jgi:hypothetical protein
MNADYVVYNKIANEPAGASSVSPAAPQAGEAKAGERKKHSNQSFWAGWAAADGPGRTTPDHTIKW